MRTNTIPLLFVAGIFNTGLAAQTFTLTSKNVGGQATMNEVVNGFGCTGANMSPQLTWTNPP